MYGKVNPKKGGRAQNILLSGKFKQCLNITLNCRRTLFFCMLTQVTAKFSCKKIREKMREHAFWWKILFFSFSFAQKSLKSSRAFKKITRFLTFSILALFLGSKIIKCGLIGALVANYYVFGHLSTYF